MELIFDTSSLIVLVDRLELHEELSKLSKVHPFFTTERVYEEYLIKAIPKNKEFIEKNFKRIAVVLNPKLDRFLDPKSGEITVLSHSINENNPQIYCVIDENPARKVCEIFEIQKTSSIGILKILLELDIVKMSDLHIIKKKILGSDFHVKKEYLDWIS